MAKQYTRDEVKARLQAEIAKGKPIIIAGAGTGISGNLRNREELTDRAHNSGLFRMDSKVLAAMPYGDANQIVIDLATSILVIKKLP